MLPHRVEDEVFELPLIIMQSNIGQLVSNERFSHQGPKAQSPPPPPPPGNNHKIIDLVARQNWGPNPQETWEQMQIHALIPRLYWCPNPQGHADHVSLRGKIHPLPRFIYLKKIKLRKRKANLLELYSNST